MTTKDSILLVHAYVDGELDAAHTLTVKAEIERDPALAAEAASVEALQSTLRSRFPPPPVSDALRRRITAATRNGPSFSSKWPALAATLILGMVMGGSSTWFVAHAPNPDPVAMEVLNGHIRGLIAANPLDVTSSERHAVKPWFNGRVPLAPRVINLAAEGYPLLGARIDVVAKTQVPTLVYTRRLHKIAVTAIPIAIGNHSSARSFAGFNMLSWADATTRYFVTSDLNAEELSVFAKLFRDAPGA
jgi:anti-sigma factor RsiW